MTSKVSWLEPVLVALTEIVLLCGYHNALTRNPWAAQKFSDAGLIFLTKFIYHLMTPIK